MNDLSVEQSRAFEVIEDFMQHPSKFSNYICVHGLAGTGKTHLLAAVAKKYLNLLPTSPTGKAASVLRKRIGADVATAHSRIYDYRGSVDTDREDKKIPVFSSKEDHGLRGSIVGLDECSMVGTKLAKDLLQTGARIIAFGDPGQLEPVGDTQFFTQSTCLLTEPHRTALESPIIRQAHLIRSGQMPCDDTGDFRMVAKYDDSYLMDADVVLCWRNKTRVWLNNRRRQLLHYDNIIRKGELVMCLQNQRDLGIWNGEIYEVLVDREPGSDLVLKAERGRVFVLNPVVEGIDADFIEKRYEDGFIPFAFAYACTVHKSQGSEWENVTIINEMPPGTEGFKHWLYTAVTRSSKQVSIIRSKYA